MAARTTPKFSLDGALGYRDEPDRDQLLDALESQLGHSGVLVFTIKSGSHGETVADLQVAASVPYLASFLGLVALSECRSAQGVSEMTGFANSARSMIHVDDQ
jgi:hypothetical protein